MVEGGAVSPTHILPSFIQLRPEVLEEVQLGPLIGTGSMGRCYRGMWQVRGRCQGGGLTRRSTGQGRSRGKEAAGCKAEGSADIGRPSQPAPVLGFVLHTVAFFPVW
jgi:hypothetical protein